MRNPVEEGQNGPAREVLGLLVMSEPDGFDEAMVPLVARVDPRERPRRTIKAGISCPSGFISLRGAPGQAGTGSPPWQTMEA